MNAYEMRLEMWRSSDAFLRERYEHLKEQYKAGLIPESPAFPTYAEVSAHALQMREFVNGEGATDD